jgi:hypothetical protein
MEPIAEKYKGMFLRVYFIRTISFASSIAVIKRMVFQTGVKNRKRDANKASPIYLNKHY